MLGSDRHLPFQPRIGSLDLLIGLTTSNKSEHNSAFPDNESPFIFYHPHRRAQSDLAIGHLPILQMRRTLAKAERFATALHHFLREHSPSHSMRDYWSSRLLAECLTRMGKNVGYSVSDTAVANWMNGSSLPSEESYKLAIKLIAKCLTESDVYTPVEKVLSVKEITVILDACYYRDTIVQQLLRLEGYSGE